MTAGLPPRDDAGRDARADAFLHGVTEGITGFGPAQPDSPMVPVGSKIPRDQHERLRWLAYRRHTTVSAIIAGYVGRLLPGEDMTGYAPADPS